MDTRFDRYEIPAGHEDRFLAKLDAATRPQRRQNVLHWSALTAAAAAAILAFVLIPAGNRHFLGAHTPEAVYCAYLDKVGAYYEQLGASGATEAGDWEAALTALTDETIPLFDQLPDEMPRREKVRVLKRYYGDLLDGAERLRQDWDI